MGNLNLGFGLGGDNSTLKLTPGLRVSGQIGFHDVAGGATTLFHDTFTEAGDEDIEFHDPDIDVVGTGWTEVAPSVTVIGGGGYATLSSNGTHCLCDTNEENIRATLTGTPINNVGKQQVIIGYQGLQNLIQASFNANNKNVELWQLVSNSWTMLDSGASGHSGLDQYTMTAVKNGNFYSVEFNETEIIPPTEITTITPIVGRVGLRSNTTALHQYDEILVTTL